MAIVEPFDLREALGEFVAAQPVTSRVRPEIVASWQRSISASLHPDRFDVPFEPDAGDAERLAHAARPILEHLLSDFSSASMCLVLTDKRGRIVERLVGERSLRSRLDGIMLAPGFRYGEGHIGTNAIGTTLQQRAPSFVVGGEHFADSLTGMACAAAPILDPATDSILGTVDLTCSVEHSQSLMLAVARHAARDIERELLGATPSADRVLLERFLRARHGVRSPMVGLNGRVMYTNAPAVKLLEGTDRALLWDIVSAALVEQPGVPIELALSSGPVAVISIEAIADDRTLIGALLRFRLSGQFARRGSGIPQTSPAPSIRVGQPHPDRDQRDRTGERRAHQPRDRGTSVPVGAHRGVHLRQVFRKLDVGSRVELTRHYLEQTAAPRCRDGRRRESLRVDYANA